MEPTCEDVDSGVCVVDGGVVAGSSRRARTPSGPSGWWST